MPNFQDANITESSGAAFDWNDPTIFYTMNDENGPVYAVDEDSGKTVGKCGINRTLIDPEGICMSRESGNLFVLDGGANGNHTDRTTHQLVWRDAFGRSYPGTPNWSLAKFRFPDDTMRNTEALFINPVDGHLRYICTKTNPSKIYRTPHDIENGGTYDYIFVESGLPPYISDMCYSPDGNFLLARQGEDAGGNWKQNILLLAGDTFELIETLNDSDISGGLPSMPKPEGISIKPDQQSFVITSEGQYSTFYSKNLPTRLRPGPGFHPCG